jgi:hypothetical protein
MAVFRCNVLILDVALGMAMCVAGTLTLVSCGGDTQETAADTSVAAPDPRFASAESLLTHVTALLAQTPQDAEGFFSLFYLENDWQRLEHEAWSEIFLPYLDLNRAALERFGRAFWLDEVQAWPSDRLSIAEAANDRAIARSYSRNGTPRDLHLVKVGAEWKISGYSWEYLGGQVATAEQREQHRATYERMKANLQGNHAIDRQVTANIRSGKYATLDEASADRDRQHRERILSNQ